MEIENAIPSGEEEAVKDSQNVDPAMEQDEQKSDEVKMLEARLNEVQERLQNQSALIGKLTNEKKREAVSEEEKKKPQGEISQYEQLKSQMEAVQQKMQKQERAAKLNAIELALIEAGADTKLAKTQADYFAFKLNDRISAEEDDSGNINVQITDTDGESVVPVNMWAKAFIGSDRGSYLRAKRTGPSVDNFGGAGGQARKIKLSSVEYSKQYSLAHMNGVDAAKAFVASHEME